jgi:hypothetical protein
MPDFRVTDVIESKIYALFDIPKENVKGLNNFYQTIAHGMKRRYLAHVIQLRKKVCVNFPAMQCLALSY